MCNFSKEDVLILARAIVEEPLVYMSGDFPGYFFCDYCDAELKGYDVDEKDFKHALDCPVLVAQDILKEKNGNE